MPANDLISFRKGTGTEWTTTNPVLASGEPGYDITNNILKVGDGITSYNNLPILFSGIYQPSGNYSTVNHTHTSNQISDFNSSVSGLLPVRNIISGSGISISSSSGNFTINSTGSSGSATELVYDYPTASGLPASGDNTKLYCTTDTNRIYRWTGSVYVELGPVGGEDTTLWNLFLPGAPTGVTGTVANAQSVVSWTAPTGVATQTPIIDYVIQYSSNNGSTWTTFNDNTSTSTSATVTDLTNETSYLFRVAAVNGVGQGAYSTASAAVTPTSLAFPQTISGLEVWLDASDPSTLYDATTGGSLVAANGTVARWEDKSGNGRHATQSTSANRPQRKVSAIAGLDSLLFDGTNDRMLYSGPNQSEATIFAVVRRTSTSGNYCGVFTFAKTFGIYSRLANSGQWGLYNVQFSGDNPSGVTLDVDSTYVLTARRTSSNRFLYTNGTLSATVSGDNNTDYTIDAIGADSDNTQCHFGHICELLAYSSSLGNTDRAAIESYLKTKWGVA